MVLYHGSVSTPRPALARQELNARTGRLCSQARAAMILRKTRGRRSWPSGLPSLSRCCGCLAFAALPAGAQNLDELYAKAKGGRGARPLYRRPGRALGGLRQGFFHPLPYPGIAVSVNGGFSNVLDRKIDEQIKEQEARGRYRRAPPDDADFVRWKGEGSAAELQPPGYDKIDRSFRDKDAAFIPLPSVNAHVLHVQCREFAVAPKDVPKSALDSLKPLFRGKARLRISGR